MDTFELPNLQGAPPPTYQQIKSTFNPESVQAAGRFALSELVANQLSVEQEEQRRFQKKVDQAVEAQLKLLRTEAHRQAYDKGLEEGRKLAYEEEKARIARNHEAVTGALTSLTSAKQNVSDQYEQMLLDCAFRLARVLVHKEVELNPASVAMTIRAILEKLAKEDDVRVRISSHEFEAITEIQGEVAKVTRPGGVSFELDASLKAGDCIVESPGGEIASFMEEKIQLLYAEVDKARAQVREGTGT